MPNEVEAPLTGGFSKLADFYLKSESELVPELPGTIALDSVRRTRIKAEATALVKGIRRSGQARSQIDKLLQEYGLSTEEGVTLMRLSEALIRTPDFVTSRILIRDKIGDADWTSHAGQSDSFFVNQATTGLRMTSRWIAATGGTKAEKLVARIGDRVMKQAMAQAMTVTGNHFVLGRNIREACERGQKNERKGFAHSYDMLGESAYTFTDAQRYFDSYLHAINYLAAQKHQSKNTLQRAGLSVKLSALHPRYEYAKREYCVPALVGRIIDIARVAAQAGLWVNIDAEEADRLELSLEIFERLLEEPTLRDWAGLGMVVQAYQRRAGPVLDYIKDLANAKHRRISVRLVKGAYWDGEIKRAQELGLPDYPVFTRKETTDVSYLACARKLLNASDRILPQFATHNAHTAVSIVHMAGPDRIFEFQRLHGMGAALHEQLSEKFGVQSRIYAPVGSHQDLLPYLVRRLLENSANGSFVNQMMDENMPADDVAADPISIVEANSQIPHPKIPAPVNIVEKGRLSAPGIDLTQSNVAECCENVVASKVLYSASSLINGAKVGSTSEHIFSPQDCNKKVGTISRVSVDFVEEAITVAAYSDWATQTSPRERARILEMAADILEQDMPAYLELCVREAGKTLPDAVAEVREAVDFCRYYALQARNSRMATRRPLGVVACISPWNFPLAIFLGQVVAALSVGNTVVAKPAAQTPIIAAKAVELLHRAGVPPSALQLLLGDGAVLGDAMTRHPDVAGICFTGSTRTAKRIANNLAGTSRPDIPFIAETGGINAMIVDSTALLEQAAQDVVKSAYQSAGQRCSSCRIVCVQSDIASRFVEILTGAMEALEMGDPARLSTDVGPVIDAAAHNMIEDYKSEARKQNKIISEIQPNSDLSKGCFAGPALIEVTRVSDVKKEVFGPVLHFVRFESSDLHNIIDEINSLGFGLTMGLHTRLDGRVEDVVSWAHVGNLYVNRNQIGAVVGVHPFGGEGLSGTGPKAGGPYYLFGLTKARRAQQGPAIGAPVSAAPGNADKSTLQDVVRRARKAAQAWQRRFPLNDRLKTVGVLASGGAADLAYEEVTALPGPTGEQNTLRLCPRGTILCFGGETAEETAGQILRSLVAGSSVILAGRKTFDLKQCSGVGKFPSHLVQRVTFEEGLALIDFSIEGIVADGGIREHVAAVACRREGPILPILSATDPIERFLHERTLTINTTAAGGNASLLTMN